MEPEIQHERVRGDGVELHVARAGRGKPVVLLHGFPEDWRSWRRQIGPLARAGFSVLAPDLRGYHRSDRPRGRDAYHLRHLVADVAALARHTGQRVHLVGHDWGGIVAWTFAGAHPELLDQLVILNAPHLRLFSRKVVRPPQLLMSWYAFLFQLPVLPERLLAARDFAAIRRLFRDTAAREGAYSREDIDGYVAALSEPGALTAALNYYRALRAPGATALAHEARAEAETLVIWGDLDPALEVGVLEGLGSVAPRARVHHLPDVAHWVHREATDEVNHLLLGFLRA